MQPSKFFLCHSFFFFLLLLTIRTWAHIEIPIYQQTPKYLNDDMETNVRDKWDYETIALRSFMNSEYYGIISVGSPAKQFKMVFHSKWVESYIPSQDCPLLDVACMLHTRYDSSKSSTYQEDGMPFKKSQSNGYLLSGFFSQDNFHLPHIEVANQSFIEATQMSLLPFSLYKSDGVIGLALPSTLNTKRLPFIYNMLKQKLIHQSIFSLYMNRDATTDRAGVLLLGATDRKHLATNITILSLTRNNSWQFRMDRITVDAHQKSYPFCASTCEAVIDTSTNTIAGPPAEIDKLNNLIGARKISFKYVDRYMINCKEYAKLPDINFILRNKAFTINSKYYVQWLTYNGFTMCLSPFISSYSSLWELGGAFLMQFYTEYNINDETIGIAKTIF